MVKVIGTIYKKNGEFGDHSWMMNQEEYLTTLFIYNDNIEFIHSCKKGRGNAIMRVYNKYSNLKIPRSYGIPTGSLKYGGFKNLNIESKKYIDNSISEIKELIDKYSYDKIIFSRSETEDLLGTDIFIVDKNVIRYITSELYKFNEYI